MDTGSLHKLHKRIVVGLGTVCALYLVLVAGTSVVLNHAQILHLEQQHVSRIWLPASYQPEGGYEVALDVVLRDLNHGLLFSPAGARVLDSFAVLWLVVLGLQLGLRFASRSKAANGRAIASSTNATMRQPLQKAAPYGATGRRATRGKVLEFRR